MNARTRYLARLDSGVRGWVGITLLLLLTSSRVGAQVVAPYETRPDGGAVTAWVTAGAGVYTRGVGALAGGQVGVSGRILDARYLKSTYGEESSTRRLETYAEHYAVLVGHTLGARRRSSVSVGVVKSKAWSVLYTPCRSDCWFGYMQRGDTEETANGTGVAFAARTRTAPALGVMALGLELTGFLGDARSIGLSVSLDVGRLQ